MSRHLCVHGVTSLSGGSSMVANKVLCQATWNENSPAVNILGLNNEERAECWLRGKQI